MKVNNITRVLVACIWCMCTFLVAAEATTKVTPPQEAIEHREALKIELQQKALLEVEQKALEQALIEKNTLMQQQETEGAIFQMDPETAIVPGNEYIIGQLTIPSNTNAQAVVNAQGRYINNNEGL